MKRQVFHIDFETFSRADLVEVGAGRYSRDPSTEVLCLSIKQHGHEPVIWLPPSLREEAMILADYTEQEARAADTALAAMRHAANMGKAWIVAHNAPFEFAIWNNVMVHYGFTPLPASAMKCTAVMARRACIPHSLEKCGAYLNLPVQKDQRGKTLIKQWCVMQKPTKKSGRTDWWRRTINDDPEGFSALLSYCRFDTKVEELVHDALGQCFDFSDWRHDVFTTDLLVNEEGFPVDLDALRRAKLVIEEHGREQADEFTAITGLSHTQRDKVLLWLEENGYRGGNMQGDTISNELKYNKNLPEHTRRALELKLAMSFAAVAKIETMLECAGPDDNRVRHTLMFHGASTGRWSSKLVQQQNFKRPEWKGTERAFMLFRQGMDIEALELIYGPIIEMLANCIRHFIHDIHWNDQTPIEVEDHCEMDSVDYAAIEARIVCWLAGQEDALEDFRNGVDRYKIMATRIYGVPIDDVSNDQRFVGKQTVLGCGYGMGASKFQAQCLGYGVDLPTEECELAVTVFRETHPHVRSLWYDLERAAKNAILYPGQKFTCRKLCCFTVTTAGKLFLFIRLPSGRCLAYPEPSIDDEGKITFFGQLPMSSKWGRVHTYGGKLVENATQAVAADCMGIGLVNAWKKGFRICMLVHDEAVRTRRTGGTLEDFIAALVDMPAWADGLPLKAEGSTIPFYKK